MHRILITGLHSLLIPLFCRIQIYVHSMTSLIHPAHCYHPWSSYNITPLGRFHIKFHGNAVILGHSKPFLIHVPTEASTGYITTFSLFLVICCSFFDKTMILIQSHHLNDYNDCTVHYYAPGANFRESSRWMVYQALSDGVSHD